MQVAAPVHFAEGPARPSSTCPASQGSDIAMDRNNTLRPAVGVVSGGPRPSRLRRVVAQAHYLGAAGVDAADAIEATEHAIFADGALPAVRASQRRAWAIVTGQAEVARHEGARVAVRRDADLAVREFGGNAYHVLFATAFRAARYVRSDDDVIDAVKAALAAAGYEYDFGAASPMFPIRRARRAQAVGDDGELRSFRFERSITTIESHRA